MDDDAWRELIARKKHGRIDPKTTGLVATGYAPAFAKLEQDGGTVVAFCNHDTQLRGALKQLDHQMVSVPKELEGFAFDQAMLIKTPAESRDDRRLDKKLVDLIAAKSDHRWIKLAGTVFTGKGVEKMAHRAGFSYGSHSPISTTHYLQNNSNAKKAVFYEPLFERFRDYSRKANLYCFTKRPRCHIETTLDYDTNAAELALNSPYASVLAVQRYRNEEDDEPYYLGHDHKQDKEVMSDLDRRRELGLNGGFLVTHSKPIKGASPILNQYQQDKRSAKTI